LICALFAHSEACIPPQYTRSDDSLEEERAILFLVHSIDRRPPQTLTVLSRLSSADSAIRRR